MTLANSSNVSGEREIRPFKIERIYTVGLNIDEIKFHPDGSGKVCTGRRGKIVSVERNPFATTATIECETCHKPVQEGV